MPVTQVKEAVTQLKGTVTQLKGVYSAKGIAPDYQIPAIQKESAREIECERDG